MCKRLLTYLIAFSIIAISFSTSEASTSGATEDQQIAVLPFVNYSGDSKANQIIMDIFFQQLEKAQLNVFPNIELRNILRKNRIRSVGSINDNDIIKIRESSNISRILLGSINIYKRNQNPEISISVRLVDANQMKIIAACTQSAQGTDFESLFGLGVIESHEALAQIIVEKLIQKLVFSVQESNQNTKSLTIALIPLDNLSEIKKAGLLTTNILLTTLVEKGYNIIEPGIIENIMLKNKRILRGEIDFLTLNQITSQMDIDIIITGSVDNFQFARGSRQAELEIGIRTIDASNGKIISMYNNYSKGNDSESIFGMGKIDALGNLIRKTIDNYIHTFEKKSETYFAKEN